MARTRSSKAWLTRHVNDHFVQQSVAKGYRSRAAFKLLAIDEKDHLFRRGQVVVDLGAAPGSWCQIAREKVGEQGRVFALDLLPMPGLAGVDIVQGDFREDAVLAELERRLENRRVDLVICDMAPNITGSRVTDQARTILLCELALEFAQRWLRPGGHFLTKIFQGEGFVEFQRLMQPTFAQVVSRKPDASRDESRELYLLGKHFKPTSVLAAAVGLEP